VVDVGGRDAADVGRDGGDRLEVRVPGPVDRLGRQGERGGGQRQEPFGVGLVQAAVGDGAVGQLDCLGREQPTRGDERLEPLLGRGVEEAAVSVTSMEVKTRKGLRASSSVSVGRNAVDTTGTELEEASRRS